jgi:hypothetical protein
LISITEASPELTADVLADAFLADIIDQLPSSKYTLVYITSPREYMQEGESDSGFYDSINDGVQEPFHMDLKRDYAGYSRQDSSNNNKPLFEKYQFFGPGSFYPVASWLLSANIAIRHFHGLPGSFPLPGNLIRWDLRLTDAGGPLCCFRKRHCP